jgi:hypothetical protein
MDELEVRLERLSATSARELAPTLELGEDVVALQTRINALAEDFDGARNQQAHAVRSNCVAVISAVVFF